MQMTQQAQVRMDAGLKKRIHGYMKKFEKETRAKLGFSDAVRTLLRQALDREGIK